MLNSRSKEKSAKSLSNSNEEEKKRGEVEVMRIVLKTMPPALNATYRSGKGRFYKDRGASLAQKAVAWEIRNQYRGKPLEGPVAVEMTFWWKNKRKDIDSSIKATLDACTGILWLDDRQVVDLHVWKECDKENPRVELDIFGE